jgi:hypothetical protein
MATACLVDKSPFSEKYKCFMLKITFPLETPKNVIQSKLRSFIENHVPLGVLDDGTCDLYIDLRFHLHQSYPVLSEWKPIRPEATILATAEKIYDLLKSPNNPDYLYLAVAWQRVLEDRNEPAETVKNFVNFMYRTESDTDFSDESSD